ncbi:hypothetical protein C0J45_11982 [Silurus meridionalis]|nr:hypothetical protein C0J45_11982 [Silurus meridionalis]
MKIAPLVGTPTFSVQQAIQGEPCSVPSFGSGSPPGLSLCLGSSSAPPGSAAMIAGSPSLLDDRRGPPLSALAHQAVWESTCHPLFGICHASAFSEAPGLITHTWDSSSTNSRLLYKPITYTHSLSVIVRKCMRIPMRSFHPGLYIPSTAVLSPKAHPGLPLFLQCVRSWTVWTSPLQGVPRIPLSLGF